jgi:hypothetical protein
MKIAEFASENVFLVSEWLIPQSRMFDELYRRFGGTFAYLCVPSAALLEKN